MKKADRITEAIAAVPIIDGGAQIARHNSVSVLDLARTAAEVSLQGPNGLVKILTDVAVHNPVATLEIVGGVGAILSLEALRRSEKNRKDEQKQATILSDMQGWGLRKRS